MRVIGGTARGRQLRLPRSSKVRPTTDRVREAIFDVLSSLGAVEGAAVLDAFAGSGALGIEALSRGAASVTFVECDRQAARFVEDNLAATGFAGSPGVEVVRGDVVAYLSTTARRFDLAFLDPPYAFEGWERLLEVLRAELVVAESDRPIDLPAGFGIHRSYRYGTTLVTVARATEPARQDGSGAGGAPRGPRGGEGA